MDDDALPGRTDWDGEAYQRRFDELAATGKDLHGEARVVRTFAPRTVLDAGCGTGRVAIELARPDADGRSIDVTGVDVDASMLATAHLQAARSGLSIVWERSDLADLDLGRVFDVVVMAGNVPLFTPPGTQEALVAGVARHVAPEGVLIAGFGLGRGYGLDEYDEHCAAAGLTLADRWATWDGDRFTAEADYAVSFHRRA